MSLTDRLKGENQTVNLVSREIIAKICKRVQRKKVRLKFTHAVNPKQNTYF